MYKYGQQKMKEHAIPVKSFMGKYIGLTNAQYYRFTQTVDAQ